MRGALNIVLRSDLDGFEARTVTRLPTRDGGDGWQGSVFWGGEVGDGRMTLGVDVLHREEIAARSREYSRSQWPAGGAFNEAQNVSVGGNTVWVVQFDDEDAFSGVRSVALGECDPAKGYTGPLSNPPGITSGDLGCGFAYGAIMWNTSEYEQQGAILNLDHPLSERADLRLDANFTRSESAFRYAPSVGSFDFEPDEDLLATINEAAGSDFVADNNDLFVVGHRFVRHGNRDWRWDAWEYDVAARGRGSLDGDPRLRRACRRFPARWLPGRQHPRARGPDRGEDRAGTLRPRQPVLGHPGAPGGHRVQQLAGGEGFRRG